MRVAIVSHMFPTEKNPVHGVFVLEQAAALRQHGVEVVVLSPQWSANPTPPASTTLDVRYGSLVWRRWLPSSVNVLLAERQYRNWLTETLARESVDVVHAHYGFPDGVATVKTALSLQIPCVVTLHGSDVNRQMDRPVVGRLISRMLQHADAVVCVGEALRRQLAATDRQLGSTAVVIRNGYNPDEIEYTPCDNRNTILFVGRLRDVKNPLALVDAFADVAAATDLDLVMAGDGPLRDQVHDRITSRGIAERVHVLGNVDHGRLKTLYARAKMLVLPSKSEGLPIVALEALASGVPVVASAVGSLPEIVKHGENGLLVEPGNTAGLSGAILSAAETNWAHGEIASTNRSHTWGTSARALVDLYRRVCEADSLGRRMAYLCLQATREGQASYAHVHEIIKGLVSLGWRVDLFQPGYSDRSTAPSLLRKYMDYRSTIRTLNRTIGQYDVLYVRDHPMATSAIRAARCRGVSTVLEVNGAYDEIHISYPWTRFFRRWIRSTFHERISSANGLITSTRLLEKFVKNAGYDSASTVIGCGADPMHFTPRASPNTGAPYVLFFGVLAKWQGIRTLIAALEHPSWPQDAPLVVAGDGADRGLVEDAMRRGLPIVYHGVLPYASMPKLVEGASLCVIPCSGIRGESERVGLSPVKLFEAMACAVPVVVSDLPDQSDIVRKHHCGLVVPPDDSEALACAVRRLLSEVDLALEMGRNGREAVETEYAWAVRARQTNDFIVDLTGMDT